VSAPSGLTGPAGSPVAAANLIEPGPSASEKRRLQAMRRRWLRASVGVSAVAIVGATVVNAGAMASLYPRDAAPAVLINGIEALVALTIRALIQGRARRWTTPLAFMLATSASITVLHLIFFVPDFHSISLAYLILTPPAVALFLPWSTRVHLSWLLAMAMGVGAFYISSRGGILEPHEWVDTSIILPMSAIASLLGNVSLDRQRRESFRRRLALSRLRSRGLAREAVIGRLNGALAEAARVDPLTGLWNRRRLTEELAAIADRWVRYRQAYAAVMVDIDRFKDYNDVLGHLAGDAALQRVATVLRANLRASDSIFRYGGEEFLVLMPEQGADEAARAAERLRVAVESLAIECPTSKGSTVLTVSAGIAILGGSGGVDALLRQSDAALYEAKRRGRNRVIAYNGRAPSGHRRRLSATTSGGGRTGASRDSDSARQDEAH